MAKYVVELEVNEQELERLGHPLEVFLKGALNPAIAEVTAVQQVEEESADETGSGQ